MPLSHLIALMIHTRRRKAVRINQINARSLKLARSKQTTHAIKPAHAALHTDYSAVVRMIRTSKTMVADASQHPHLMLQRARSIPQEALKPPAKTLAGLLRDLPVRVIILFTMSNNPKRPMPRSQGDHKQRTRETCCSSTNTFSGEAPNEAKPRKAERPSRLMARIA